MKVFIPVLCLMSLALAEPPVGDGYPDSRSLHDDHHHDHQATDHQRSPSQEYGPPDSGSSRNAPFTGYDYNAPNSRSSSNGNARSQFPPATVRVSFNQRFSKDRTASAARSSQGYDGPKTRNGFSQGNNPSAARSLSQKYGTPVVSARSPSTEYGVPNARSAPSEEYGVPVVAARSNQKSQSSASNFRSVLSANGLSQDYSALAARSQFQTESNDYTASSARSNDGTQGYNAPKPFAKSALVSRNSLSSSHDGAFSRSQSTTHGVSSARNADSQSYDSVSQTYGAPSARGLSQEYGVPSGSANQMTEAIISSYASARTSPSSTYLPASRNAMPSEQYGVPEQRDGGSQGYEDARTRAALEELQNQEPANYDFGYQIEDQESGSDFGHTETREEDRAQGSYFVVLPDGTKQTVDYSADEDGYKPRISVEPAAGGYDENAADVTGRAAGGPY